MNGSYPSGEEAREEGNGAPFEPLPSPRVDRGAGLRCKPWLRSVPLRGGSRKLSVPRSRPPGSFDSTGAWMGIRVVKEA